jgi:hypothetical protein
MVLVLFANVHRPSVIVHNRHVGCVNADPTEANPPLIVDPNAVLSAPISSKRFQTIPWNRNQIGERSSRVQVVQLSLRYGSDPLEFPAEFTARDLLGLPIQEAPNHASRILLPHV